MGGVRTAVILAAGSGSRLHGLGQKQQKGFLRFGKKTIVEELIARLQQARIQRVVIATGHCREHYDKLTRNSGGLVTTIFNDRFSDSGSMYSLYCTRHQVDSDFVLLESDLIYEQRALSSAWSFPRDNCLILSEYTKSNDEVFVQLDEDRLVNMSKNREQLSKVDGELVGITRISMGLFSEMLNVAEAAFKKSLHYDYETGCLIAASKTCPVYCTLVPDLVWAEIDDTAHLERAQRPIYPEILKRDGASS